MKLPYFPHILSAITWAIFRGMNKWLMQWWIKYIYVKRRRKNKWKESLRKNNFTRGKMKNWQGIYIYTLGGARGVMVIVLGNGHSDTSSNPGWDWLHFT